MKNSLVIINDDPAHANPLSEVIEHYGNKVSEVGFNGKDTVELFQRQTKYCFFRHNDA